MATVKFSQPNDYGFSDLVTRAEKHFGSKPTMADHSLTRLADRIRVSVNVDDTETETNTVAKHRSYRA